MKLISTLLATMALLGVGSTRAELSKDVTETTMPIMEFVTHVLGGPVAGRHYAPLAFVVGTDSKIQSLVSGTVADLRGAERSPTGSEMVSALQHAETIGFDSAEVANLGPRFLALFEAGLKQASIPSGSQPMVVFVRNPDMGNGRAGASPNALDEDWEAALRQDFKRIHPNARLLIVRLVFPTQASAPPAAGLGDGCASKLCQGTDKE